MESMAVFAEISVVREKMCAGVQSIHEINDFHTNKRGISFKKKIQNY